MSLNPHLSPLALLSQISRRSDANTRRPRRFRGALSICPTREPSSPRYNSVPLHPARDHKTPDTLYLCVRNARQDEALADRAPVFPPCQTDNISPQSSRLRGSPLVGPRGMIHHNAPLSWRFRFIRDQGQGSRPSRARAAKVGPCGAALDHLNFTPDLFASGRHLSSLTMTRCWMFPGLSSCTDINQRESRMAA